MPPTRATRSIALSLPLLALAATACTTSPEAAMARTQAPALCAVPSPLPPRPDLQPALHDRLAHSETARIAVPWSGFGAWFVGMPLERLLPGTADIPAVVATRDLTAAPFPEPGSRRLVCLADGGSAIEEVLRHEPGRLLSYVVWGYTSAVAQPLGYGIGEFRFTEEGYATRLDWTYAFRLKPDRFPGNLGALGRGLFRLAFLDTRYARFMRSGMAAIEREALAARP
jgi:hypothetical protein